MAKQTINIGSGELAGNGESIRSAFSKINDNFDELYTNGGGGTGVTGPQGPSGAVGAVGPTGPAGTGGTSISTSDTAPLTPELGDLWYDTVSGRMYVYYDSGWVDANPSAVGPIGPQGPSGSAGPTGAVGLQGVAGSNGAAGPQGPQGVAGAGSNGAAGPQGPQGVAGATGPQGVAGSNGAAGPQGPQGVEGPRGAEGETGSVGATGPQGNPGVSGPAGPRGVAGENGAVGATGPQGDAGPRGLQGDQGVSIVLLGTVTNSLSLPLSANFGEGYIAVDTGRVWFWGTNTAWNDVGQIVGPKGDIGDTGPAGATGDPGAVGPTGPQGDPGQQGDPGPAGATGDPGAVGPTGPQGDVGPTGPQGDTGPTGPAGGEEYTPTTPTDWNGSPTVATFTAGLDELAGRTSVIEGTKDRITTGSHSVVLGADGVVTLPNASTISSSDIGFSYTAPSNGPGGYSVSENSLTVGIPNPSWAADILANPNAYHLDFNGGPTGVAIGGISGPAPSTNVYTLTGTWPANATGFPMTIASNDYLADLTTISSDNGLRVSTTGGSWTFGLDGTTTFPNNAIKQVTGTDLSIATTGVIGLINQTCVTVVSSGTNYLGNSTYGTDYPGTLVYVPSGPGPLVSGNFVVQSTEIFTVGDIITIPASIQNNTTATLQVTSTLPYSWSFANTGQLNLPQASNGTARIQSTADIDILSGNSLWTFDTDGVLTLPSGNTRIGDVYGGGVQDFIIGSTGTSVGVITQGTGGYVGLQWADSIENIGTTSTQVASVVVNSPIASTTGTVQILTGITTGTGIGSNIWEFGADGTLTAPGHLLPNADLAYDLGSTTTQWRSIYVGTGTIFIGGVALGVDQNNYVTVDGNPIITINTAGNFTVQGDTNIVLGAVVISDTAPAATTPGSQWYNSVDGRTYVAYNGAWVDASPTVVPAPGTYLQDITIDGSTLNINGGTLTISNTGTLLVNGSEVTGSGSGSSTHIEYTDGQSQYTSTVDLGYNFEVDTQYAHLDINGDGTWEIGSNNFDTKIFSTIDPGNDPTVIVVRAGDDDWTFGPLGWFTLPNGGVISEVGGAFGGAIRLEPSGASSSTQALVIYPTAGVDGNHIHLTAGYGGETDLYLGNDSQYVKVDHSGTIVIGTLGANTSTWTFGTDGIISLPNGMTINASDSVPTVKIGGTSTWISVDNGGAPPGFYVRTDAGGSDYQWTFANDGILSLSTASTIIGASGDPNVYIETATTATTSTWTFGTDGILTLPAATPVIKGGGTGTDVTIIASTGSNTSTWTFAADGTLTFPDNTVQTTAYKIGQTTVELSTLTEVMSEGYEITSLEGINVIYFTTASGYTDVATHLGAIPLPEYPGQRVTIINDANSTVTVAWTVLAQSVSITLDNYDSSDLIAITHPKYGGLAWWETNRYNW
jgi:hypothetical protein